MHHSDIHYPLMFLVVGLLLLLLGRRLFWLFVGAAGFVIGVEAAPYILPHQGELFTLIVALVLGLVGALLAIFVQKLAVAIGGFVGGGYLAAVLCAPLMGGVGMTYPGSWLCFLIGGILGAILMMVFFNWALIILSSLQGAHLIVRALPGEGSSVIHGLRKSHFPVLYHQFPILVIVLAIVGIVIQASTYRRRAVVAE
jgi:hypothetical protein